MKTFIICFLWAIISFNSFCQKPIKILGSWEGNIQNQGVTLKVVLNFYENNGILSATMDSPDQSTFKIPVSDVSIEDHTIHLNIKVIQGEYNGVIKSNSIIDGIWLQSQLELPLILNKIKNK